MPSNTQFNLTDPARTPLETFIADRHGVINEFIATNDSLDDLQKKIDCMVATESSPGATLYKLGDQIAENLVQIANLCHLLIKRLETDKQ